MRKGSIKDGEITSAVQSMLSSRYGSQWVVHNPGVHVLLLSLIKDVFEILQNPKRGHQIYLRCPHPDCKKELPEKSLTRHYRERMVLSPPTRHWIGS